MAKKANRQLELLLSREGVQDSLADALSVIKTEIKKMKELSSTPEPLDSRQSQQLVEYAKLLISANKEIRAEKSELDLANMPYEELKQLAQSYGLEIPDAEFEEVKPSQLPPKNKT